MINIKWPTFLLFYGFVLIQGAILNATPIPITRTTSVPDKASGSASQSSTQNAAENLIVSLDFATSEENSRTFEFVVAAYPEKKKLTLFSFQGIADNDDPSPFKAQGEIQNLDGIRYFITYSIERNVWMTYGDSSVGISRSATSIGWNSTAVLKLDKPVVLMKNPQNTVTMTLRKGEE
ncbi:hypothetical protein [Puniceicoccus vermicola]|uniref:Uncharacterized protein n=1 Tax=Puniceicoccus vermicola TaxID=388746 RepID=A0A7X1AVZ7_9BACT|nr:hypothetical protein [Puniceicoccus vermicola]MBC2600789.1 hypothetical protein [Puniceicoccus vermicola]